MPRLTYDPSRSSCAARCAICSRVHGIVRPSSSGGAQYVFQDADYEPDDEQKFPEYESGPDQARRLDDLFNLGDSNLAASRRQRVEVARRLPVDKVAEGVGLPSFHQRNVSLNSKLKDMRLTTEVLVLFTLGDKRSDAGASVEAGIPAPPARMRSASVPCGQNSTSSSPDRN